MTCGCDCSAGVLMTDRPCERPEDESNLLYVAITRARKRLQMSRQLYEQLGRSGHRFFRLVPTCRLRKDCGTSLTCCVLGTTFEPQWTVTLCRRRIKLVSTTSVSLYRLSLLLVLYSSVALRMLAVIS